MHSLAFEHFRNPKCVFRNTIEKHALSRVVHVKADSRTKTISFWVFFLLLFFFRIRFPITAKVLRMFPGSPSSLSIVKWTRYSSPHFTVESLKRVTYSSADNCTDGEISNMKSVLNGIDFCRRRTKYNLTEYVAMFNVVRPYGVIYF